MTKAPDAIIELYKDAQIATDMDCGVYVGGTDRFGMDSVLEAIAEMVDWELPEPMTRAEREQRLRDEGREGEIEYLGCLGDD